MPDKIQDFVGGTKSLREHLNKLVKRVNELSDENDLLKTEIAARMRIRVNNLDNDQQMIVDVLGEIIRVDPLFCCCNCSGSGEAHGGA